MVERVADVVIFTEKAPLVRLDFSQVKGCQRKTSCGKVERQLEIIVKVSPWEMESRCRSSELHLSRRSHITNTKTFGHLANATCAAAGDVRSVGLSLDSFTCCSEGFQG